jgi:hypothetical protein
MGFKLHKRDEIDLFPFRTDPFKRLINLPAQVPKRRVNLSRKLELLDILNRRYIYGSKKVSGKNNTRIF